MSLFACFSVVCVLSPCLILLTCVSHLWVDSHMYAFTPTCLSSLVLFCRVSSLCFHFLFLHICIRRSTWIVVRTEHPPRAGWCASSLL
jgi:hypothetical protein